MKKCRQGNQAFNQAFSIKPPPLPQSMAFFQGQFPIPVGLSFRHFNQ